ncbi:MAG: family 20 glycosylhydrolase [FCB group bacterium]|jgi:hexosaminidase
MKPSTIPALQEWKDNDKAFIFNSKTRIVIDVNYFSQLNSTCQTFQEDILALKGITVPILIGNVANPGDIFFSMSSKDTALGDEGYSLDITDRISINALTETGVFYSTRTILQLLRNSDTIFGGNARDWSQYKFRGLMVDNGRKYFSVSWLENHIKELSYLKMNSFTWHFSDNEGFRIECQSHPEITTEQFLTKTEVKYLLNIASKYHIRIMPEIDMPGHMGAILRNNTDLQLTDSSGGKCNSFIDITSNKAKGFIIDLLMEYLVLFPDDYWRLGADEFIYSQEVYNSFPYILKYAQIHYGPKAVPSDTYLGFINWIDSIVISHGKQLMICNDAFSKGYTNKNLVRINTDITIDYWEGDDQPQDVINAGFKIINSSTDFFYYNLGSNWIGYDPFLYEKWEPEIFQGGKTIKPDDPQNLGSKFCIWCAYSNYETEGHVALTIRNVLRIIAQGLWHSPKLTPNLTDFVKIIDSLGRAPGVEFPKNPMPDNLVFGKRVVASSVDTANGSKVDNVIDANYNTRWTSAIGDSEWVYVDLEDIYNITRVKLVWFRDTPLEYKIQTSFDAQDWTTIYSPEGGGKWIDDFSDLKGKGRFVRILCSKNSSVTGYSLWELEVYDSILIKSSIVEPNIIASDPVCFPNPVSKIMKINYILDKQSKVDLNIFDLEGNIVAELVNEEQSAGSYYTLWNTGTLSNGTYFCRIGIGKYIKTFKIELIK